MTEEICEITEELQGAQVIEAVDRFTTWRNRLILNNDKKPRALLANVITALRLAPEWRGVLRYDEFARETVMERPPPWIDGREGWIRAVWTDTDDVRTCDWMQRQGIYIKDRDVSLSVQTIASENSFHPIRDYLGSLAWDCECRIETFLPKIFGTAETPYEQAVFRCFMIGAVARIYEPGCKMDTMLTLEGPQGARKSTAVRELFGECHYTDDMPDLGTKDAAITAGSAWCIELAELSAMTGRRKDLEAIKAFITRRVDNFRPPYGRRNIKIRRQSVLVGTTNADTWMRDETGGRRFWPVKCGEIDVPLLQELRDQLWAEAVALYHLPKNEGGAWWFEDGELIAEAREQQEERYVSDPWEPPILEFVSTRPSTTTEGVMLECLEIAKKDFKKADFMRVANILKRASWSKKRTRSFGGRGYVWLSPRESMARPGPTSEQEVGPDV